MTQPVNNKMIEELKPCPTPWCGIENPHYMTWINQGGHIVHCLHCHVTTAIKKTKAEAIAAWNTRTDPDKRLREASPAMIEAGQRAFEENVVGSVRGLDYGFAVTAIYTAMIDAALSHKGV